MFASLVLAGCAHTGPVTVAWSFEGIQEGYDHPTRVQVFVDGAPVAESSVTLQSEPNKVEVPLEPGAHMLKVVNFAQYEGSWEEHTVANDYAIDCVWEGEVTPSTRKVDLVFDIDEGTRRK
ncbi:MAG: hypothetical protein ABMA64_38300 [Myxococcota bacterium]